MEDSFHLGIKALIKNSKGEILLLKVNPDKLIFRKDWNGIPYWDIPGGRVKKGEGVLKTLKKEIYEETGISQIKNIEPFLIVLSKIRIPLKDTNQSVGLILSSYTCEVPATSNIKLSEEHVEAKYFPPNEVAELLKIKYPKEFTDKIKGLK
jgi:8-oxo-dGTP pyrophosphatase MutT (NUDIX family)